MKKLTIFYIIFLVIFVVLTTFTYNNVKADNKGDYITAIDSIYFTRDILPLINSNCAKHGCHDTEFKVSGLNLTTYANIMQIVKAGDPSKSLLSLQIKNNVMPPNTQISLTSDQKATINKWISQGAINSQYNNYPCDSTYVSYDKTIRPIMATWCYGCHSGAFPGGEYVFTDDALVHELYSMIYQGSAHLPTATPVPPNIPMMDSCSLAKVRIWYERIRNGIEDDIHNDNNDFSFNLNLYPNPAKNVLNLNYFLPAPQYVSIELFDMKGTKLISKSIMSKDFGNLNQSIPLNDNFQNGIYLCKITANNQIYSKKFTVIK